MADTRYDAIVAEANRLDSIHPPYNNARPPSDSAGYDCSSSCAQLMKTAGYSVPYFNTGDAPQYMERGEDPSHRVTFWNNDTAGTGGLSGQHIFATIGGHDWGTSASNPGGGPGWMADHPKSSFVAYHVSGLDQPASVPTGANTNVPGGGGGTGGVGGSGDATSVAKAAAFATFLELPGLFDTFESRALAGQKSLMNDQPLFPFVQQLCQASLRNFQSMPNGNFFAFFPDYFGGLDHRTPYWEIHDIEIIDGGIDLSDDALATHVYVVGDIVGFDGQVTIEDKLFSSGVVTVFNAFAADFLNGLPTDSNPSKRSASDQKNHPSQGTGLDVVDPTKPTLFTKDNAIAFLQKYGARPKFEPMPMIRSPFFELFLAYQTFCLMWSQQFLTTFEFTFMPELFPGGIVAFPEHGIQCYIDEVVHEFDYESGFITRANLSAPAALPGSDRKGINAGMIRSFSFSPTDTPFDPFTKEPGK